jgi:hypothetical protein
MGNPFEKLTLGLVILAAIAVLFLTGWVLIEELGWWIFMIPLVLVVAYIIGDMVEGGE